MNLLVNNDDIGKFLTYILTKEKTSFRENPVSNTKEEQAKINSYIQKVEQMAEEIAVREGVNIENKKY